MQTADGGNRGSPVDVDAAASGLPFFARYKWSIKTVNRAKKVNIAPKGAIEIMNTLAILIRHMRYVIEAITIV